MKIKIQIIHYIIIIQLNIHVKMTRLYVFLHFQDVYIQRPNEQLKINFNFSHY